MSRPASPMFIRFALALGLPFLVAVAVAATYLNKEVILGAGCVALVGGAFVLVQPIVGIVIMTALFLMAAYPTLLQSLGFLTINNLLGAGLLVVMAMQVIDTRDLSFLKNRYVHVLLLIGGLFLLAGWHGAEIYPFLQKSRGKMFVLDKSDEMTHDFIARLVFFVFFTTFVRTRDHLKTLFLVFMFALFLAVPSALVNWMQGTLNHGFRAEASITAGSNPNRLGMICLMEVACWWFWAVSRPTATRFLFALGAIAGSMAVLLATGSRSALLGCGVLALALETGVRKYRVPLPAMIAGAVVGLALVVTIVPPESWQRMITLAPEQGEVGASSNKMREQTIWTAVDMVRDNPLLGIGIGRFREVSRQVYFDPFYRPPHNSVLWAASEGGLPVLGLYFFLLWLAWKDLSVVTRLAHRDPELGHISAAVRVIFILYVFFSFFADLYLNPITYIMIGLIVCLRRYVEGLPEVTVARAPVAVRVATAA